MNYFKATRPDGTDFRTGTVDYTAGEAVIHPAGADDSLMVRDCPFTYLSVSVEPAETLIGGSWPCRLFRVEPVGKVLDDLSASPNKRACRSLRVVEEIPAWQALGPNGKAVAALVDRAGRLTYEEAMSMDAAWEAAWGAARKAARDAAWDAAWEAARGAAWDAAWGAAWGAAGDAAWDAATAMVVRDLITAEQFEILYGPWRSVIGE